MTLSRSRHLPHRRGSSKILYPIVWHVAPYSTILHVALECVRNLITCDGIWVVFVPFYDVDFREWTGSVALAFDAHVEWYEWWVICVLFRLPFIKSWEMCLVCFARVILPTYLWHKRDVFPQACALITEF